MLVADLDAGIWCDVVLLALAAGEDVRCLLADPLACGDEFRDLLAWCLVGSVPNRYQPYAATGPLFDVAYAPLGTAVVQLLDIVHSLGQSAAAH